MDQLFSFFMPVADGTQMAFIPLLVMAGIAAASAIASGVAGAAQNNANQEMQADQSKKNRDLQTKLAKNQLAEQQREFTQNQQQSATQGLLGAYDQSQQSVQQGAQRQQAASNDVLGTLSKAFLRKGN